jgi:hypothetical protein
MPSRYPAEVRRQVVDLARIGRASTVLFASRLALASDAKQAPGDSMQWA